MMSSNNTKSYTKKRAMIQALEKSLGVVTSAAKSVGIGRDTHYRWMREDPDYRKEVESVEGIALDFAESGLHEQILEGNITAIIFYLKTKGKVRGYIERSEVVQKDDKPDLSDLSTEDLIKLVKEAEES